MALTRREREKLMELKKKQDAPHEFLTEAELRALEEQVMAHENQVRDLSILTNFNNLWSDIVRHVYALSEINLRLVDEVRKLNGKQEEQDNGRK